ncbi:MAG: hypothetical protein K9I82_15405, partial [Chitinophagaceae bacterium]|nr:hypothetical protein [Chitinophagaceae bacterium]
TAFKVGKLVDRHLNNDNNPVKQHQTSSPWKKIYLLENTKPPNAVQCSIRKWPPAKCTYQPI